MMKESVLLGVTPLPWIRLRSNCVVNISVKEDGDIDANVMSRDTCSRASQNGSSAAAVTYTSCELIFCPISFSQSFSNIPFASLTIQNVECAFSPARRRLHDRPFSKPLYMAPALRREKTFTPKSSAM